MMERPSENRVLRFQTAFLFFTADFRRLSPNRSRRSIVEFPKIFPKRPYPVDGLGGKVGRIGLLKRPLLRQAV